MSFVKLLRVVIIIGFFSFCATYAELTVFAPVGAPQGFLNTSQTKGQTNSLISAAGTKDSNTINGKTGGTKNDDGKQRPISLSEIAKNVKNLIEEYTKRRDLAQKQGSENRYDELLKDANALAKEIEDASHKHDELRMEQSQKGNAESGAQADRLTEIIQSRTEPFNSLLWRMDQVIAEIKHDDASIPDRTAPDRTAHEDIPPTFKLASRTQLPEKLSAVSKPTSCEDDEEEEISKQKTLQPFKAKDDLDGMDEYPS